MNPIYHLLALPVLACLMTLVPLPLSAQCPDTDWADELADEDPCVCDIVSVTNIATGELFVWVDANTDCNAIDYPDTVFDCAGNVVCYTNGEVMPDDYCEQAFVQNLVVLDSIANCNDLDSSALIDPTDDLATITDEIDQIDLYLFGNDEWTGPERPLHGTTWYLMKTLSGIAGFDLVETELITFTFFDNTLYIYDGSEGESYPTTYEIDTEAQTITFDESFIEVFPIAGPTVFYQRYGHTLQIQGMMPDGFAFEFSHLPEEALFSISEEADFGSVTVNPNGTVTYSTGGSGSSGLVTFEYQFCGSPNVPIWPTEECEDATVSILIDNGVNSDFGPIAMDDEITLDGLNTTIIYPFGNDSHPLGLGFDIDYHSQGEFGTVNFVDNGFFEYTPGVDFVNYDSFEYSIVDPVGLADTATVYVYYSDVPPDCTVSIVEDLIEIGGTEDEPQSDWWATYCFFDPVNSFSQTITSYHWTVYRNGEELDGSDQPEWCNVAIPIRENAENVTDEIAICLEVFGTDGCESFSCIGLINPLLTTEANDDFATVAVGEEVVINTYENDILAQQHITSGQDEPILSIVTGPTTGTVETVPNEACFGLFCDEFVFSSDIEGTDSFTYQLCVNDYCQTAEVVVEVGEAGNCPFPSQLDFTIGDLISTDDIPTSYIAVEYCFFDAINSLTNIGYGYNFSLLQDGEVINGSSNAPSFCAFVPVIEDGEAISSEFSVCLDVIDANGCVVTNCIDLSADAVAGDVWPGDSNADGFVNNFDVLTLGWGYYQEGPARATQSIEWAAQLAENWNVPIATVSYVDSILNTTGIYQQNIVDAKHADCNGDGEISELDLAAIDLNYGFSHGKAQGEAVTASSAAPFLRIEIQGDTLVAGSTVTADIILEDQNGGVAQDVYGIAFTIDYDNKVDGVPLIVENTMQIDFESSWLGNNFNTISLTKDFAEEGRLEVGHTRIDHQHLSGAGKIATLTFVIEENVAGKTHGYLPLEINVDNSFVGNASGVLQPLNNIGQQVDVLTTSVFSPPVVDAGSSIEIGPNPTHDLLNIVSREVILTHARLFDITGRLVIDRTIEAAARTQLDLSSLNSGLYLLSLETADGQRLERKIELLH